MEKVRIHELAKVLNTSSKRIIEKLNEINIFPKGAMSYLEPGEYNSLRKYLGMAPVETAGSTASDSGEEKSGEGVKTAVRKKPSGIGGSNNIIKRRVINSENEEKSNKPVSTGTVSRRSAGSGLRSGYVVRDDEVTYATGGKAERKTSKAKPDRVNDKSQDSKTEVKPEVKVDVKPEVTGVTGEKKSKEANVEVKVSDSVPKEPVKNESAIKVEEAVKAADKKDEKPEVKSEPAVTENIVKNEEKKPEPVVQDRAQDRPENTSQGQSNYQGNRDRQGYQGQGQNNYQGNRDRQGYQGQGQNNYQGNRDRQGYQGQNRQGYQGQNNNYQGNRQGYQGQGQGNYQNRQGGQAGQGYQGQNRQGYQGQNNYQGNRQGYQGQGQNGYQNRDRQGYQGQGGQGQNGYQNRQGYQPRNNNNYVPGKDDEDTRPAYQRRQPVKKEEKPEAVQKAELNARIEEAKKEAQAREQEKFIKRENKKENAPKSNVVPNKGKRNNKLDMPFVGEKKGVNEVFSDEFVLEGISDDSNKFKRGNRNKRNRRMPQRVSQPPIIAVLTHVTLPESLTVKELAESLKKTSAEVMKKMLLMGIMANVNQVIDFATAEIVADEFGIKATQQVVVTEEDVLFDDAEDENDENAVTRPPVVVVMGHVDHGKTSLLDAIRSEHVVTGEAGGITQHIGAYTVNIKDRDITFLDTPGHEAFTAMRARGAQTTDIAILVVAADDGVMPQTVESINHAKAANVSIIVAVNKIDKVGANVDRVMQELTEHGLVTEEWGGDTIFVPVSAKKNENIDTLLEMVLLTADVMELKANPNKQPKGTVIEAKLDKNRGPVSTVLVQRGTLRLGDSVVTGTTVGRIRAMTDDKGKPIKEAGPSIPVEILGLPDVPQAGEVFYGITDEKLAKQLAEKRKVKIKEEQAKSKSMVSLDDLFNQIQDGNIKEINIIVKADVQGSVEAVKQSLEKLSNEDVRVRIIHGAVGAVNESDISLAQVSNAMIIGFNVRPGPNVQVAAETAGVDMRLYTVIYNAIEDVSSAMKGMLDPTFKEVVQGHAEIRQIYKVSGVGTIAGSYVTDGKITRNSNIRLVRDGIVIHDGKLASLKRFKDDAKEVLTNFEFGFSIEKYNDIKELDVIEAYIIEEVKRD